LPVAAETRTRPMANSDFFDEHSDELKRFVISNQ
jgi:hypothetical protein